MSIQGYIIRNVVLSYFVFLLASPLLSQEKDSKDGVKSLIEELKLTDYDKAQKAKLLLIAKGEIVIPQLLDILADYYPGLEERIEELVSKLSDEEWAERDTATQRIIAIGAVAKPHLDVVIKKVSPEIAWRIKSILIAIQENAVEEEVQINGRNTLICEILGEIGNKSCGNPLIKKLQDKDVNVRTASAEAIGKLKITDADASLIKAFDVKKNWREKSVIIWSLGRLKAKSAMLLVKKILEDVNENLEVKDKCLFFLTSVNTPDSIKLVLEQLNSEISYIRAKALKYITAITNDSFGYDPNSITEERTKALQKFETWWKKQYSQ